MVKITSHKERFAEQSSNEGSHRFKGRQEQGRGQGKGQVHGAEGMCRPHRSLLAIKRDLTLCGVEDHTAGF